ncbi:hypothetical protein ASG27_02675 [Acidovorax sp. Leaf191]|nr:hypothetical protein ASG27_02675 [Acidovorax sp. Leaf191]
MRFTMPVADAIDRPPCSVIECGIGSIALPLRDGVDILNGHPLMRDHPHHALAFFIRAARLE